MRFAPAVATAAAAAGVQYLIAAEETIVTMPDPPTTDAPTAHAKSRLILRTPLGQELTAVISVEADTPNRAQAWSGFMLGILLESVRKIGGHVQAATPFLADFTVDAEAELPSEDRT